jgi:hypothetical protein
MKRRKEVVYVAIKRAEAKRLCSVVEQKHVNEGAVLWRC